MEKGKSLTQTRCNLEGFLCTHTQSVQNSQESVKPHELTLLSLAQKKKGNFCHYCSKYLKSNVMLFIVRGLPRLKHGQNL